MVLAICVAARIGAEEEREVYNVVARTVAICSMAEEVVVKATVEDNGGVVAIDDAVASRKMVVVVAESAERARSGACIKRAILSVVGLLKNDQTSCRCVGESRRQVAVAERENETVPSVSGVLGGA